MVLAAALLCQGCSSGGRVEDATRKVLMDSGAVEELNGALRETQPLSDRERDILRQALRHNETVFLCVRNERPEIIRFEDWTAAVDSGQVPAAEESLGYRGLSFSMMEQAAFLAQYVVRSPPDLKKAQILAFLGNTEVVLAYRGLLAKVAAENSRTIQANMIAHDLFKRLGLQEEYGSAYNDLAETWGSQKAVEEVCGRVLRDKNVDLSAYKAVDAAVEHPNGDAWRAVLEEVGRSAVAMRRLRYHVVRDPLIYERVLEDQPEIIRREDFRRAVLWNELYAALDGYAAHDLNFSVAEREKCVGELLDERRPTVELPTILAISRSSRAEFIRKHAQPLAAAALRALEDDKAADASQIARDLARALDGPEASAIRAAPQDTSLDATMIRTICAVAQGSP
jgi:hypothetical protein